ncbi:MAG: hypothetical protein M0Z55_05590 [Peptococcaceae bacterium]|nr:hypothetical protein [Peptococcaceae bacterium]
MRTKILYLLGTVLVITGLILFNWHLNALPRLATTNTSYFIHRLIMALWLVIPGFALELPRLWSYFTGKVAGHTDWWLLLIYGLPALILTLLPFFVAVLHFPLPNFVLQDDQLRLLMEALGAFWLGITIGKSIILDK